MSGRYRDAGRILEAVVVKKIGLKTACYAKARKDMKRLYALVCETLKRWDAISTAMKECGLWDQLVRWIPWC